jgi:peroxiredoxin
MTLLLVFACGKTSDKKAFTINGEVDVESGIIYLQDFHNKMFATIDSAVIENGKFTFTGSLERPDLFGLTLDREETFSPYFIFLENSQINVNLSAGEDRIEVSGSAEHKLYDDYLKAYHTEDFNLDSFVTAHPASVVTAYLLYRNYSYVLTKEQIDTYVQLLDPSLHDTQYVQVLNELSALLAKLAVGQPAPDFSVPDPEGNIVSLSGLLGKGYLLIDFWASWCGPCRRENPNLVQTYNEYKDKGFNIFSVSLDKPDDKESWLKAIADDQLTWAHASDLLFWDSAPAKLYGVRAIPSNVLVDKDGIIVARNLRGEDLGKKLAELLN